jgi:putative ABC transport system ATP-binding protein
MSNTVLALKDVGLTLQGNAGPVEILKGISLNVTQG